MTVVPRMTDEELVVQQMIDRIDAALRAAGEDPDEPFVGEIPEEEN